jgi:nitroreductase
MDIDALRTLVKKRRSIRGYDESQEISDDTIQTILDIARWAPSGGNGQPWEFIVVREQAVRHQIADYYVKQMEQKREMDLAVRGTAKMTGDGFRRAPVHILILGSTGERGVSDSHQTGKSRVAFHYRLGECDAADSPGGDFNGFGVTIC